VEPDAAIARLFLRQVIGLGGPREWVAGKANQLAGYRDVSRLTFTVGQLAVPDLFDDNTYSHDPRTQFWNWALWDAGAWDFAANARGYTQGVAVELNQEAWAVRYGAFLPPRVANGNNLPLRGLTSLSHELELEERYEIFSHPGKMRLLGFFTCARMGIFHAALHKPGDPNENIAQTRRYGHTKYGGVFNVEQEFGKEFGGFLRGSWNDGHTEDWAFTQIDWSVAGGVSLQGGRWGRSQDTLGVAGALNGLSDNQRKFLAAGGLGLIIGDGRLHYASEGIVEAYYDVKPWEVLSLTLDYQFICNPGDNRDRGPVHVFGVRLHIEF
jgi:high affinity Mn2+ porin